MTWLTNVMWAALGAGHPRRCGAVYVWVWRHLLVVFFLALTLSLGLRVLARHVAPGWPGWAGVRPAVGILFVLGLIAYALWWLRSR